MSDIDEFLRSYYYNQLNNIDPKVLQQAVNLSKTSASENYNQLKSALDLKRQAEYELERQFRENRGEPINYSIEEFLMPSLSHMYNPLNRGQHRPFDKGHKGLLQRQKLRGMLEESRGTYDENMQLQQSEEQKRLRNKLISIMHGGGMV